MCASVVCASVVRPRVVCASVVCASVVRPRVVCASVVCASVVCASDGNLLSQSSNNFYAEIEIFP